MEEDKKYTAKEKAELKEQFIQSEMELIKTEDYSTEDFNDSIKEINSVSKLIDGEELPPEDLFVHHNLMVSLHPDEADNMSHQILTCRKHHKHEGCD